MDYKTLSQKLKFTPRKSQSEKREILATVHGGYYCKYCDAENVFLVIEHVIPSALGGSHGLDNVVLACEPCNIAKRGDLPDTIELRDP